MQLTKYNFFILLQVVVLEKLTFLFPYTLIVALHANWIEVYCRTTRLLESTRLLEPLEYLKTFQNFKNYTIKMLLKSNLILQFEP